MKKLLLTVIVLCVTSSIWAQDPDLVNKVWKLNVLEINGVAYPTPPEDTFNYYIQDIVGPFYSEAAAVENIMFGEVVFDSSATNFTYSDVGVTLVLCIGQNCDYEDRYFYEFITTWNFDLKTFSYEITTNPDTSQTLVLTDSNGNTATYNDQTLSVYDIEALTFKVFPNPTQENLFISTEEPSTIESIPVYSINGKQLIEQATQQSSIDVSSLPSGLYFLEVATENGKAIQKFIKN